MCFFTSPLSTNGVRILSKFLFSVTSAWFPSKQVRGGPLLLLSVHLSFLQVDLLPPQPILRISLLWNTLWLVLIYHLCKQNWEPVVFANNEIFKEFQTRGNIMPQPAYLLYLCLFGLTLMRTFRQPPPRCGVEQIVCKWVFNSYFVINHTFLVIIL